MPNKEHQKLSNSIKQKVIVPDSFSGKRLDQVLSQLFHNYSRSQLQKWIKQGNILVNGIQKKAKNRVIGGENILLITSCKNSKSWKAEDIPLKIVYEDHDIIVINKPHNLVVHPGAGNSSGTLLNALLAYDQIFYKLPRAGIVHRLDKGTSGLMVVAKNFNCLYCISRTIDKT